MSATAAAHLHPASRTTLRGHLRRAAGRDNNPLCRPLDRAYSRLVTGTALMVLVAVVLAVVAALLLYRTEADDAARAARHWHVVTAVTTGPAQSDDPRGSAREHAPARWTYPVGPGAGSVPVPDGTTTGTALRVGLNDAGQPLGAPRSNGLIVSDAVLVGLATVTTLGFGTEGWVALRRHRLDRRSEADWESEWEQVEPGWSGRR
ncbi:hypothetical protein ACIRS1_29075 [Kitasatospora sp. NPDC101176]|uniref:Rv1733c family protein n=1 Tax=Kitasatospora sp. NPDC101176 TaxID=3364099 RepID=UPI00381FF0B7